MVMFNTFSSLNERKKQCYQELHQWNGGKKLFRDQGRKTQEREMTDILSCHTLIEGLHSSRITTNVQNKSQVKKFFLFPPLVSGQEAGLAQTVSVSILQDSL